MKIILLTSSYVAAISNLFFFLNHQPHYEATKESWLVAKLQAAKYKFTFYFKVNLCK